MPNQQLLDYVNFKSKQGISKEEIKKILLESGWKEEDIDVAFNYRNNTNAPEIVNSINNDTNKKKQMSNWILALLLIVSCQILTFVSFLLFKSSNIMNIFGSVMRIFLIASLIYIFIFRKVKNNLQNIEEKNIRISSVNKIMSWIYIVYFLISIIITALASISLFNTPRGGFNGILEITVIAVTLNILILFSIIIFLGSKNKIIRMEDQNLSIPYYFKLTNKISEYFLIIISIILIAYTLFNIRMYL